MRWVLAPSDRPIAARSFVKAFSGSDGVDVWRNDDAYARAFVVYRTRVATDEAAQAAAVADPTFRPSRFAVVDRPIPGVPELEPDEEPPLPNEMFALYRENAYGLAVEVVAAAPGVLVMSEAWYPGWRVTVDNQPAELLRVDYALRGVALAPGTHVIAMDYEDDLLPYGAAVSLTSLTLLAGLVLLARSRRRRAHVKMKREAGERS